MAANTIIHSVDTNKGECIVTMYDGDELVIDQYNIGIVDRAALVTSLKQRLVLHRNLKKLKEAKIL